MQIILNGNNHILEDRITLDDLLKKIYISNNKLNTIMRIKNTYCFNKNYLIIFIKQ